MTSENGIGEFSKTQKRVGWALGIVPSLLLFTSASMKFIQPAGFDEGLNHLGWNAAGMKWVGVLEIACVAIYLIPRTAVLGAVLLAAYMGGAVATHARVGDFFIFQVLVGMAFWLGLWLRDRRLRSLLPLTK